MPLNKYSCHTAHVPKQFLHTQHIDHTFTTYISQQKNQTALFLYHAIVRYVPARRCPSNATYMPYEQITQCASMVEECQYTCQI